MIDRIFSFVLTIYLKYKLHQLKGANMKCFITVRGLEIKLGGTEAVKQFSDEGKVTGVILPGTKVETSFKLEEFSTCCDMTPEEFKDQLKEVYAAGQDFRTKVYNFAAFVVPTILAEMSK